MLDLFARIGVRNADSNSHQTTPSESPEAHDPGRPVDELDDLPVTRETLLDAGHTALLATLAILTVDSVRRRNGKDIFNTAIPLALALVPESFGRLLGRSPPSRLRAWVSVAMVLHAVGTVGDPRDDSSLYDDIGWWDHVTHLCSSSATTILVVAGIRAANRSFDLDLSEETVATATGVSLGTVFMTWEALELALTLFGRATDQEALLTFHGRRDFLLDTSFNVVGAILTAIVAPTSTTEFVTRGLERLLDRLS